MDTLRHAADSAWEAAQNVALDVVDGSLIHKESPFSPDVPEHLAHNMPDLTGRLSFTFPWTKPSAIDPANDYVWILDNTAFRSASVQECKVSQDANDQNRSPTQTHTDPSTAAPWQAEYVATYFAKRSGKELALVVGELAKKLDLAKSDPARATVEQRIRPFVDTVLPRRTVKISVGGNGSQTLGPSSTQGISSAVLNLPPNIPSTTVQNTVTGASTTDPNFLAGETIFAEPTGWGLISDIDDTIKVTLTHSAPGILKKTFVDPLEVIQGMPELYAYLNKQFSDPATFYLSASPYNLYSLLRPFLRQNYPPGTTILRDASWQNLGGLISSLTQNVQEYKADRISKIHGWFPDRRFVCFGDSTQKDPESYGEAARKFPGWIKGIFIRKISGKSDITDPDQNEKNSDKRFEKAFEGLDKSLWFAFDTPDQVRPRLDEILARG